MSPKSRTVTRDDGTNQRTDYDGTHYLKSRDRGPMIGNADSSSFVRRQISPTGNQFLTNAVFKLL